jgi:hypothetical protein
LLKLIGGIFNLKQIDEAGQEKPTHINAFQLIGMASSLDLSGFFEEEVRAAPFLFKRFFLQLLTLSKEGFAHCH